MIDTDIQILPCSSLKAIYNLHISGDMSDTYMCNIEWNDKTNTTAFVKRFLKKNQLGLVNEITGYILAKGCNLPVPRFAGIIKTNFNIFPYNENQYEEWCFLTSEIEGDTPASYYNINDIQSCKNLMDIVAGWNKLHTAIAFDDWIANEDRHLGNIIISNKNNIHLFDHSNIPICLNWTPDQLIPEYNAKSILTHNLYNLSCPLPMKSKVTSEIDNHRAIYEKVKDELKYWWDIFLENDEDRRNALEKFISKRAELGKERVNENLRILI